MQSQIRSYIQNTEIYRNMRTDLLRASILGFVGVIILFVLILKLYEQDGGLNASIFLISGLAGFCIVLYKPGRPAQVNRKRFSIPKDYSSYEKILESVILQLRKRFIVILLTLPYFLWLGYLMLNQSSPAKSDINTVFGSILLSFLFTLILGGCVQYFQVWLALQKEK